MGFDFIGEFACRLFGVIEDDSPGITMYYRPLLLGAVVAIAACAAVEGCAPRNRAWTCRVRVVRALTLLYGLFSAGLLALLAVRVFCAVTDSDAVTQAGLQHHRAMYVLGLCYAVALWSGGMFVIVCVRTTRDWLHARVPLRKNIEEPSRDR